MTKKKTNPLYKAVSFRFALIDSYKKLNIKEDELAVILVIDHLLSQGNLHLTGDMISLKMNFDVVTIEKIMVDLMKRGYLFMEYDGTYSIDGLKNAVYEQFANSIAATKEDLMDEDKSNRVSELYILFESKFNHSLSPIEKEKIVSWVDAGFDDNEIKDALIDVLKEGKKSIKEIDKLLRQRRINEDYDREGVSAVNENWDKDIEETLKMAREMWGSDDD